MRRGLLLGVVCVMLAPAVAWGQSDLSHALVEAEAQFRQRQYRHTIDLLLPTLYPEPKLSRDNVQRAREILGAAHWYLNEKAKARQEWQFLLIARPAMELDTFVYPKPMRDFFEHLRENLIRQGIIVKAREVQDQPPTVLREIQIVETRSRAMAFMPFGIPQFEYDQNGWGYFFATSQVGTGLASLGSMVALYAYRWADPGLLEPGARSRDNSLMLTTVVTGAAFYALYLWGAIDANTRHEPRHVVRIERVYQNLEAADVRPPQPQKLAAPHPFPRAGGAR